MADLKTRRESAAGAWGGVMFHKMSLTGRNCSCGLQFWTGGRGACSHGHGQGFG